MLQSAHLPARLGRRSDRSAIPTPFTRQGRPRIRRLTSGLRPGLTNMKLSRFVPYYAGAAERGTIAKAREDSFGKRDALKAMRVYCSKWCLNRALVTELPIQLNCPQILQTRSTLAR